MNFYACLASRFRYQVYGALFSAPMDEHSDCIGFLVMSSRLARQVDGLDHTGRDVCQKGQIGRLCDIGGFAPGDWEFYNHRSRQPGFHRRPSPSFNERSNRHYLHCSPLWITLYKRYLSQQAPRSNHTNPD